MRFIKYTTAIFCIAAISLLTWHFYVCFKFYQKTQKFYNMFGGNIETKQITALPDVKGEEINLGFGIFKLPLNYKPKISYLADYSHLFDKGDHLGSQFFIKGDDFTIQLSEPMEHDPEIFNQYFIKNNELIFKDHEKTLKQIKLLLLKPIDQKVVMNDFRGQKFCFELKILSFQDILFATKEEREVYNYRLIFKIIPPNIIGSIVETKYVNAIVYLNNSTDLHSAKLWSKNGKICHNIFVKSKSKIRRDEVLLSLISSFQFFQENVLDKKYLENSIKKAMANFKPVEKDLVESY